MKSTSERTIGKLIGNAETFHGILSDFSDFIPQSADYTAATLADSLTTLKDSNTLAVSMGVRYKIAAANRRKLFFKDADSLSKRLTDINRAVARQYGIDSSEYERISGIVAKMRNKTRGKKKTNTDAPKQRSTSQRSFDSLTQHFSDIIASLSGADVPYTPVNSRVSLTTLNTMLTDIYAATHLVNVSEASHKLAIGKRNEDIANLKALAAQLKADVVGQYGTGSFPHKITKGIAF